MTETRTFADRLTSATFGRMLRRATVAQVTDLTARLRRIDLTTAKPADWAAGQKVQVQVRGLQLRTYTPFAWTDDTVSLLAFRHGTGEATPANDWLARHTEIGSEIAFTGPRKAVRLDNLTAAPIFVGDETSFALTAAAAGVVQSAAGQTAAAQVYEVTDETPSKLVLDALGLGQDATLVERTTDDAHHDELCARVIEAVTANPDHPLVLTGKAQTIKAVRQSLKTAGHAPEVRVKAHWDPRRSGLD
jgi:NADPH-dependent ferric siderophore reductase